MMPETVVRESLERYVTHLKAIPAEGTRPEFQQAHAALVSLIVEQLAAPTVLEVSCSPGTRKLKGILGELSDLLAVLSQAEKKLIINPYGFGLGAASPVWVFVGWEAAFEAASEPSFTLQACILNLLWLCEGGTRPFRQYPYDFYRDDPVFGPKIRGRGHYWSIVKKLVGADDWGDLAYLLEVNVAPAPTHHGQAKDHHAGRLDLLKRGFAASSARHLVISSNPEHHDLEKALVELFLETDAPVRDTRTLNAQKNSRVAIDIFSSASRRRTATIVGRHLSNSISDAFVHGIREAIESSRL